jgi:hypothetical protein
VGVLKHQTGKADITYTCSGVTAVLYIFIVSKKSSEFPIISGFKELVEEEGYLITGGELA